jgi:hypothetical protein
MTNVTLLYGLLGVLYYLNLVTMHGRVENPLFSRTIVSLFIDLICATHKGIDKERIKFLVKQNNAKFNDNIKLIGDIMELSNSDPYVDVSRFDQESLERYRVYVKKRLIRWLEKQQEQWDEAKDTADKTVLFKQIRMTEQIIVKHIVKYIHNNGGLIDYEQATKAA